LQNRQFSPKFAFTVTGIDSLAVFQVDQRDPALRPARLRVQQQHVSKPAKLLLTMSVTKKSGKEQESAGRTDSQPGSTSAVNEPSLVQHFLPKARGLRRHPHACILNSKKIDFVAEGLAEDLAEDVAEDMLKK
jgi:hypothetical protein